MKKKRKIRLPRLIGHRGVKNLCPENTIESITSAFDLGLKYVEIDVKISKDNVPILLHDDNLNRTTTGIGSPLNFDYSFLKKLDAGKFFYNKETKIKIPSLKNVLRLCKKRNGNLNIELKPNKNYEKMNVAKVLELTKNMKDIEIFFSSFDLISLIETAKIFPESNRSFLIDSFDKYSFEDFLTILKQNQMNICGLSVDMISSEVIKKIKENNIVITTYSNKNIDLKQANQIFNLGIDSIFTDDPRELLQYI